MKKALVTTLLLFLTLLCICNSFTLSAASGSSPALITHQGKPLFMSGMNLAWLNFANDMDNFNEAKFRMALDQVSQAGGNTVRWWIHVNGAHSPQFYNGYVTGISSNTVPTLKKALDLAYERGIGLILTLWSFDMLQNQGQDLYATKKLIEDKKYTQAYIDTALIPMVKALKDHPALIAWEVCNEPEGMNAVTGWAYRKTQMEYIQQFVNLIAGAIHREAPHNKVTNGTWNIMVLTDVNGMYNYYRDDRLIKAGGDPLGILDFYQVHFYGEHFDETTSPFHHPASYWQLDKPILIGEFAAKGMRNFGKGYRPATTLTIEEAYRYALENGYAGALAWTWTNHDGFGGIVEATPGMKKVCELAPDLVAFGSADKVPAAVGFPNNITVEMNSSAVKDYVDVTKLFYDSKDKTNLTYNLKNSNPDLVKTELSPSGQLSFSIAPGKSGSAEIAIIATNKAGKSNQVSFVIFVPNPKTDNIAVGKPAVASSVDLPENKPEYVNDDNPQTRWSSEYSNNEWIYIDLKKEQKISKVRLTWEVAFGKEYRIEVSNDFEEWTTVYEETNGKGRTEEIAFEPVTARYIRMFGSKKGTQWGFSLWEFEVYQEK